MSRDAMSGIPFFCYPYLTRKGEYPPAVGYDFGVGGQFKKDKEVMVMAILEAKCLQKIYTTRFGGNQVRALSNVSFSV